MTDLELIELQAEALFTYDASARMVLVWRFRHDVPHATLHRLHVLAADEPIRDDLRAEPHNLAAYLEALGADTEVRQTYSGPAYRFPDALPPAPQMTRITRDNLHLLRRLDWDLEALAAGEMEGWEPMLALVADGVAVSLCFSARLSPHVAEAGVNTLADHRGRGYAPAVVTAWANAIRASGRIPLYSTSWENPASQAVARKLGLVQYGTDLSLW